MVSHDATDVMAWAEEIYIFKNGKIIQFGNPEYLFHHPLNEYCANLLGDCLFVENQSLPFISTPQSADVNKKILLRASYFSIAQNRKEHTMNGVITKMVYKGNYYILHVLSNGQTFHIMSIGSSDYHVGKEIAFYYNRENVYFI